MKKLYMIFILFYLTGCSDFLKEYSQDLAYVQGYEDLDELLIGNGYFAVYATNSWESTGATGLQYYPWVHLSGDELQQIVVSDWDEEGAAWATYGFFTWQYRLYEDPDGNTTWIENNDFQKLYSHINACNMILEETKAFENKNDETIYENLKRIKGECYFLRGSCYFLLANFYGKPNIQADNCRDLRI